MNWKMVLKWFAILVFCVWALSALIVTFAPFIGMCFGVVYAACQSGNLWYMFAAQWILPVLLVAITSPAWIDYINLRHERKLRQMELEDLEIEAEEAVEHANLSK